MQKPGWNIAPLPKNEPERLAELFNYQIIDTLPEVVFDRLTRMAAQHFKTPIALVSLIDEHRQWFKSNYGIDAKETPRDVAFCAHVILQDGVMVVPDTTADPRFAGNPLVTDNPDIRFYAGAPLKTKNGFKLGTVCVIDRVPHADFTEEQKQELADFAAIAVDEMELRIVIKKVKEDLESLKLTQKALEEARAKAELSTYEKSQFIASISHELRTPMNGILGMIYLLSDTHLDKVQTEYIETISHSAQNLLLLINDVLDLSKIEAHELILEKTPFDIKTSFSQTIKLLIPLAKIKGIKLLYSIDPQIPEIILCDPSRFAQIVTNLVGNAIKFTDEGEVQATLRYDVANNSIYCEIKDTGIGIPENKRDAIFEKFVQGDAHITQKYGGTGLGLTITKQIIVMLGGNIQYESKEKIGSRFWFTIPITLPEHDTSYDSNKTLSIVHSKRINAQDARVLIAEDHPINRLFLINLLKKFGFKKIEVAENGIEVMKKIQQNTEKYDAVFMDCKMPEMDGYETTVMIRKLETESGNNTHVPIIAMTANAMTGDREACFQVGMDEYVSKPIQPLLFKEILSRWFIFFSDTEALSLTSKPTSASVPIDFRRLEMVTETATEKTMLLELFFSLANDTVANMQNSRRNTEFTYWQNAAHSLKGSAANLGMNTLSELCQMAEDSADMNYDKRTELLQQIREEIDHIKAYIAGSFPLPLSTQSAIC